MKNPKDLTIQFTKFSLVGGVNFVLTFIIFYFLLKICHIHHAVSLTITWIIGIVFSYIANFLFVFKPENSFSFKFRFKKFSFAYILSFLLNLTLLHFGVALLKIDPMLMQIILTPVVVVVNFLSTKFWSLRPKLKVAE